jgi:nucleoside-diphosphate-sugar epimerase
MGLAENAVELLADVLFAVVRRQKNGDEGFGLHPQGGSKAYSRAAVTGGTGFVGRALVRRLLREPGLEARVLSRRPRDVEGTNMSAALVDLASDSAELQPALDGVELLFHCAGELRDESRMRALHVDGTRRLIEAASGRIRRWVQLSSVGVYGRSRRSGSVDESAAPAPAGEYERTKAESDRLVQEAAARGAFELVVLRPSTVFGPGMPNQSLYELIRAVDGGRMLRIGDHAIATYVFVDDLADAVAACAFARHASGVYIVSDDRPMSVFLDTLAAELGRAPPRRVPELPLRLLASTLGRLPGFPLTPSRLEALTRRVAFPSRRLRDELGFRFAVSVEEGLRQLVRDWRSRA